MVLLRQLSVDQRKTLRASILISSKAVLIKSIQALPSRSQSTVNWKRRRWRKKMKATISLLHLLWDTLLWTRKHLRDWCSRNKSSFLTSHRGKLTVIRRHCSHLQAEWGRFSSYKEGNWGQINHTLSDFRKLRKKVNIRSRRRRFYFIQRPIKRALARITPSWNRSQTLSQMISQEQRRSRRIKSIRNSKESTSRNNRNPSRAATMNYCLRN